MAMFPQPPTKPTGAKWVQFLVIGVGIGLNIASESEKMYNFNFMFKIFG